jgi:hypothetical protein
LAGSGLLERTFEDIEFALPAHKRRETAATQRLKAAPRPALAQWAPCSHRLGEPLELMSAEVS